MTRGVIYFNFGGSHVARLAASLDSLRKHWGGGVSIINVGEVVPQLSEVAKIYGASITKLDDPGIPALAAKVMALRHSPYEETIFLGADTIVCDEIDDFFRMLEGHDIVFTHFAGWKASGSIVKRRIERLRELGIVGDAQINDSLQLPAINVGTFAYRKCDFLNLWSELTKTAAAAKIFIPDEIVAQVHLPVINHHIAPPEWGVSVKFGVGKERAKIIHYHGGKHDKSFPLCDLWRKHNGAVAAKVDLTPLAQATLVVAVDEGCVDTLRLNFQSWEFASQRPMVVIHDAELDPGKLAFLGDHPQLIPWEMGGVSQREKMLTSFVKLAPEAVKTKFWIKLDADCRADPGAKLFASKTWYKYDLVSHRWGYTKPGKWLCTLEEWGDAAVGSKRLFTVEQHRDALGAKCFHHSRIQSFACLHRTEFTKYAASLCGERMPVPSHDTYLWYVAERSARKIRRVNIKKWGFSHGRGEKSTASGETRVGCPMS